MVVAPWTTSSASTQPPQHSSSDQMPICLPVEPLMPASICYKSRCGTIHRLTFNEEYNVWECPKHKRSYSAAFKKQLAERDKIDLDVPHPKH